MELLLRWCLVLIATICAPFPFLWVLTLTEGAGIFFANQFDAGIGMAVSSSQMISVTSYIPHQLKSDQGPVTASWACTSFWCERSCFRLMALLGSAHGLWTLEVTWPEKGLVASMSKLSSPPATTWRWECFFWGTALSVTTLFQSERSPDAKVFVFVVLSLQWHASDTSQSNHYGVGDRET